MTSNLEILVHQKATIDNFSSLVILLDLKSLKVTEFHTRDFIIAHLCQNWRSSPKIAFLKSLKNSSIGIRLVLVIGYYST